MKIITAGESIISISYLLYRRLIMVHGIGLTEGSRHITIIIAAMELLEDNISLTEMIIA